jgi:hypothetical protein
MQPTIFFLQVRNGFGCAKHVRVYIIRGGEDTPFKSLDIYDDLKI